MEEFGVFPKRIIGGAFITVKIFMTSSAFQSQKRGTSFCQTAML